MKRQVITCLFVLSGTPSNLVKGYLKTHLSKTTAQYSYSAQLKSLTVNTSRQSKATLPAIAN